MFSKPHREQLLRRRGDLDNDDNSLRVSHSAKYTSPLISGFQFAALYGFGGVAGATGSGRTYSFGLSYANDTLSFGTGYFFANDGSTVASGAIVRPRHRSARMA